MSEENNFKNVQRRNTEVMAKYQWTSSLMSMQKSGNEIHDRRTKSNRKANEFLQELLQRRSNKNLLDDNGTIDRYNKFLKYKSNLNDDDILNEFDRRLLALNKDRKNQLIKNLKINSKESMTIDLQTTQENEMNISLLNTTNQSKSSSKSTITSSEENQSSLLLNHSITKFIHRPKARRVDGTEIPPIHSNEIPLHRASSNLLIFHHCHFPRSLKLREQNHTKLKLEKEVSYFSPQIKQYDKNQVFQLLDQIEHQCSSIDFTTILDQLTLSTISIEDKENNISSINNDENEEKEKNILTISQNLFEQSSLSDDYFTIQNLNIDNTKNIFVYTMTIGTVQLSSSLIVPYSILTGRRPVLKISKQTNFKQIHSKQLKQICQVTAIESLINIVNLQENDIILKINDQSVWDLSTDEIQDILQQLNNCLLTIARLCQPFI